MKFRIVFAILIGFGFTVHAEPLKFKAWKEQQIVEAQNEVLRISARLRVQKTGSKAEKASSADKEILGSRFQQSPEVTEKDLKMAQESLEIAKEFNLEDYADVYVSSLQDDSEQFSKLMNSLSKDEMTQLMKILVKNKAADSDRPTSHVNDAKQNKSPSSATLASSTSRS